MRSSVKAANDNPKQELINRTLEVWEPRFGRDLSRDEAEQIAADVSGFFSILADWSQTELSAHANDNVDVAASESDGGRNDR